MPLDAIAKVGCLYKLLSLGGGVFLRVDTGNRYDELLPS